MRRHQGADAPEGLGQEAREAASGASNTSSAGDASPGIGEEGAAGADAGAKVVTRRGRLRGCGLDVVSEGALAVSPAFQGTCFFLLERGEMVRRG